MELYDNAKAFEGCPCFISYEKMEPDKVYHKCTRYLRGVTIEDINWNYNKQKRNDTIARKLGCLSCIYKNTQNDLFGTNNKAI